MLPILRGRCSEAALGRKRYHFLRGMGYNSPAEQKNAPNPARKVLRGGSGQKKASFSARKMISTRLPGRKTPFCRRGGCYGGIWSRKRYHFLRGMGYHSPAEQKNTPIPARKVLRGGSGQKKVSFSAQNGIPTACRAEKCSQSCAEGAMRRLGAEKRHHFLRRMGYHAPDEQKNAPNPARKVLRRHLEQKKASFPAQNGIPTACRAGKGGKSCAEGAP